MTRLVDGAERAVAALLDWAEAARWRALLLVGLVALIAVVPGQTSLPVTDRDEGRFVQASKQMLETGDPIDIRFQDQPRWKKPVGIYWLQAASAAALDGGVEADIWAYRVPSAVAGVLVALLTVWGARAVASPRAAVLAGVMMAVTLLMVVEAHIAKTDAALAVTAAAALGALAHLLLGQGGRGAAAVFWLAIAASILLKGPIVPAICLLAAIWMWFAGRRLPWKRLRPLPGLAVVVLLVAPWLIAIGVISEGAFFAESLGRDMGAKLTSGQEKHWGPPGMYLGLVWGTFWPWAALIPLAAAWLWRARHATWAVLLAGWAVPFWIVLEAVPTKLPHYVLPVYPALAIALAIWAVEGQGPARRWPRWAGAVLVALPPIALAGTAIALPPVLEGRVVWAVVPLALIAVVASIVAAKAALTGRRLAQIGASALAALAVYPAVLHFGLPRLDTAFASPRMAALFERFEACAEGPPWTVGYHEPSLVFLTRTDLRTGHAADAMAALVETPGTMVLLEDRWRVALGDLVPTDAVVRARIEYFNYNRGRMQGADLLSADDPRWAPCAGG